MLKIENLNIYDKSLKFMSRTEGSMVCRMDDGRVVKFFSSLSMFGYLECGIDIYKKLDASNVMEGIEGISLPISAIMDNGVCTGYTMEYNEGVNFNDSNLNLSLKDACDLDKYLSIHKKINDLVKKCNSVDVVLPDLLTCDNIMIDKDQNISFIDVDGFQILDYPAIAKSTALGFIDYSRLKKYSKDGNLLYTKELDKKSLMYLFFLDVLNSDLSKVGIFNPFSKENISISDYFSMYGIDNLKIQKIIKDNISDTASGYYLDDFYKEIGKRYNIVAVPMEYAAIRMGYPITEEMKGTYAKKFILK